MRFFCAVDDVYERARSALDSEWGLPDGKGTETCIEPAATAPRDSQGRIVLAVNDVFCEYPAAAQLLSQLLATGSVEEIDRATYMAVVNVTP